MRARAELTQSCGLGQRQSVALSTVLFLRKKS